MGKPGVLQSMRSQRGGQDLVTEQQQQFNYQKKKKKKKNPTQKNKNNEKKEEKISQTKDILRIWHDVWE